MSVYKGNQLIAGDGIPGPAGPAGIGMNVVETQTEIHNSYNLSPDANTATNSSYSSVGGIDSSIDGTADGTFVFGKECEGINGTTNFIVGEQNSLTAGRACTVEGYWNVLDATGQSTMSEHLEGHTNRDFAGTVAGHKEGFGNEGYIGNVGCHVEGYLNKITSRVTPQQRAHGIHLEGAYHKKVIVGIGGHQGGGGIGDFPASDFTPGSTPENLIEAIGGGSESYSDGSQVIRTMDRTGNVGIGGDLKFKATDSNGVDLGRYTLSQIIEALITAGMLPDPRI